jgi:glycine/D-amino acid oxidase-like deaminating enzyme
MSRTRRSGRDADAPVPGAGVVLWLEEALAHDPGAACPPLAGVTRADVCVVGGGYTGLWAAIEVAEQAPDASVVLIERTACGFGASGRNGGWATGWHDELDALIERFGDTEGVRLAARSSWAIDRIETFAAERGIDCRLRRAGALWTATSPAQLGAWDAAAAACRHHGREQFLEEVDGAELRRRTGSPLPLAGVRQTDAATVDPARLVRGLRRAALELGVRIFESTPMLSLEHRPSLSVRTPAGRVDASRVVLATGVDSGSIRELRRAFVPLGSQIVATEPVPDRLSALDWSRGELFGDSRLMVHYCQVTPEGRVVFGQGGGAIGPAGRVLPSHLHDPRRMRAVIADFRRWFPDLADVRITHSWGGAVDRAPTHLPFAGRLRDHEDVVYALGYSGNGVAPTALLGRIAARLALGIDDEDTRSPIARGPLAYLPPEPLRSLGGAIVRAGVERAEAAEDAGAGHRLSARLRPFVHASVPRALEPRMRGRSS